MFDSISKEWRNVIALGAAFLPTVLGVKIPGGLYEESVKVDLVEITIATLPWTASVALITLLAYRNPDQKVVAGGAVAILVAGCALAFATSPKFEVTAKQATQVEYAWVAQNQGSIVRGGQVIARNPRVAVGVLAAGAAFAVLFVYASMYGRLLWVAGIACGVYVGWALAKAFESRVEQPAPS